MAMQDHGVSQDVADNLRTASATLKTLPGIVASARMHLCMQPARGA